MQAALPLPEQACNPGDQPMYIEDLPLREVRLFPAINEISNGDLFGLKLSNDTIGSTHGLHRFPAKFIPQIPRWALREFSAPGAVILDPFCGSGTTIVEAATSGVIAHGVDIDPLSVLISQAKTDPPYPARLNEIGEKVERIWRTEPKILRPPMPDLADFGHWYAPAAWAKLQGLLEALTNVSCTPGERCFLLAIYSSILRQVSNADDQSHKTYVSGTRRKSPPDVVPTFWHAWAKAARGAEQHLFQRHPQAECTIKEGDAGALSMSAESVDLILTSPPYLDSVDYMYNFMLEYFWLGPLLGVPDRAAFNIRRRAGLGAKANASSQIELPMAFRQQTALDLAHPTRARSICRYFEQMARHFREASRVLKPGGTYVMVIGNSQSRNLSIPVHECLLQLAEQSGLFATKAFAYRIRRHYMKFPRKGRGGIILLDWVIVLRKDALRPSGLEGLLMTPTLRLDGVAN